MASSYTDRSILKIVGRLTTGPIIITIIFDIMNLSLLLIVVKHSPIYLESADLAFCIQVLSPRLYLCISRYIFT